VGSGSANPSPPRIPADPFNAFLFRVRVGTRNGTQVVGGFSDVSGLNAETEVETYRVGGVNTTDVMLPGATKFPSRLVLKRGLGHPALLWKWYLNVIQGRIKRENVTIELLSLDRRQRVSWTFLDACPVKWAGPELHASTSAVAFESVDLVHRGLLLPPEE
jgi:phage tail-like protein